MSTETGRDLRWASAETSAYCWNRCQQLLQNEKTRDSCRSEEVRLREEKPLATQLFSSFFTQREKNCFQSVFLPSPLSSQLKSVSTWNSDSHVVFVESLFFHASFSCVSSIWATNLTSKQILRRFKTTVLLQLIPQIRSSGHNWTQFRYPSYPFRTWSWEDDDDKLNERLLKTLTLNDPTWSRDLIFIALFHLHCGLIEGKEGKKGKKICHTTFIQV